MSHARYRLDCVWEGAGSSAGIMWGGGAAGETTLMCWDPCCILLKTLFGEKSRSVTSEERLAAEVYTFFSMLSFGLHYEVCRHALKMPKSTSCIHLVTEVKGSATVLQLCLCRLNLVVAFRELSYFSHWTIRLLFLNFQQHSCLCIRNSTPLTRFPGFTPLLTKADWVDAHLKLILCEVSFSDLQQTELWRT